jgi:hypothetical protein
VINIVHVHSYLFGIYSPSFFGIRGSMNMYGSWLPLFGITVVAVFYFMKHWLLILVPFLL